MNRLVVGRSIESIEDATRAFSKGFKFIAHPVYKNSTCITQPFTDDIKVWKDSLFVPNECEYYHAGCHPKCQTVLLSLKLEPSRSRISWAMAWASYLGVNGLLIQIEESMDDGLQKVVELIESYPSLTVFLEMPCGGALLDLWYQMQENIKDDVFKRIKIALRLHKNIKYTMDKRLPCLDIGLIIVSDDCIYEDEKSHIINRLKEILLTTRSGPKLVPILYDGVDSDRFALWLTAVNIPYPSDIEELCEPLRNVIQTPLQPLRDNLSSETYAVFERDPTKYQQYQLAIQKALCSLSGFKNRPISAMVVGAGRGPIIDCILDAAKSVPNLSLSAIYALEKNPCAVVTLLGRRELDWTDQPVSVIWADIRKPDKTTLPKVDLIVSEMLGSFGDNELSPECLDYAQAHCLANDGIMIPAWSQSFLQPVYAPRIHRLMRAAGLKESPFVIFSTWSMPIDFPKEIFRFQHPAKSVTLEDLISSNKHNGRLVSVKFTNTENFGIYCHGFAGYFEACLFGDVLLSIVPSRATPNLFSWFPMYFGLFEPVWMNPGDYICLKIERRWSKCDDDDDDDDNNDEAVWYAWCVNEGPWHNINGKARILF